MRFLAPLVALLLAPLAPAGAQTPAAVPAPAPVTELVEAVDIPFEQFTLPNGLRVVVHTDRKTPVVAVSVWYGVGSANEPKGKTGFAHLFEHLMFNGSGGYDGEFFEPLEDIGATDYNGTTWYDRTNYFQNVPTGALDLALFLEADRMGNLLPAVTQEKLDNQRGVVQNEKRQGDNQPYGLTFYALAEGLFPDAHPYRHSTIGSMADLDAASLEDVQQWFRTYYGPNNAVLVLAGDIDVLTARQKVEKWFGAIPRGPDVPRPAAPLPVNPSGRTELKDRVPNTQLIFAWTGPGLNDPDAAQLSVAAAVLAGGASSRLYNDLVRDRQLAVSVSGSVLPFRLASLVLISVNVKPGVDPAVVEKRVDELIAQFRTGGPTADEVTRVATVAVAGRIRGLEQVGGFGGKAVALAEGALYSDDPGFYKVRLKQVAAASPQSVKAAADRYMGSPGFRLTTSPGERGQREQALVGVSGKAAADATAPAGARNADRSKLPAVEREAPFQFPFVEQARLSNGIPVHFARRPAIPALEIMASFDAGLAADSRDKPGTQALMLSLLREGTATRTGRQIVEEGERLGSRMSLTSGLDRTRVSLSALTPNLDASLALMADVIRNPAFLPAEIERVRTIQLNAIAQEEANPGGLAARMLAPVVYGPNHPYGVPPSGLGTAAGLKAVTREDLVGFHQRWIRPDTMAIYVAGDGELDTVVAALERAFGSWQPPAVPRGTKNFPPMARPQPSRILLLDRPNSPQSFIAGGQPLAIRGRDDRVDLQLANEALGGTFTSRLNTDLRETKGWSYGVRSVLPLNQQQMSFGLRAPVQADKTGPSVKALVDNIRAFAGPDPVAPADLARIVNSNIYTLPGEYETAGAVMLGMEANVLYDRPADWYARLPGRYRALTPAGIAAATAAAIDPAKIQWVVVGDAKVVKPQLEALGLPLEVRPAP